MELNTPSENPWKPEKKLWPLPDWVPADLIPTFPGEVAVDLLTDVTAAYFDLRASAREGAIGYVNFIRRKMVDELIK